MTQQRNDFEPYASIKDVAEFLGVCEKTVRRYCSSRVREPLPFYCVGRQLRFRLSEVNKWVGRTKGQKERRRGRKLRIAEENETTYDRDSCKETEAAPLAAGKEVR